MGQAHNHADCHCDGTCNKAPSIELLYDLSELFKVFGDSTRIRILTALMAGALCVQHLAEQLEMGQSAVSHQLRILRTAGLVRPQRDGRMTYYSLDDDHVKEIIEIGLSHLQEKTEA